jgi:homoserine kinase type II
MAVYTEVTDEDLTAFVAAYDIGEVLSLKGIAEGVENSNYLLHTSGGSFILTLYERRVKPADLPFFIGLMEHLSTRDVPCPLPVRASDGEALRSLAGKPAAIVTFLEGMWPKAVRLEHCSALGAAMAKMHLAGQGFNRRRPNALSVGSWRGILNSTDGRADEVKPGLAAELVQELDELEKNWPSGLPVGVIHADLFPDNVFFQRDRLSGLIDFYFACDDFFAYDLAICLNAWCFEIDGSFNVTKARRMLTSYRRVRDFTAAELKALPLLARGSAMRFLLTRLYDWLNRPKNALVTPKNPLEYYDKLRFHRGISGPGAYGLD